MHAQAERASCGGSRARTPAEIRGPGSADASGHRRESRRGLQRSFRARSEDRFSARGADLEILSGRGGDAKFDLTGLDEDIGPRRPGAAR